MRKEYLTADQIKLSLMNTPQIVFETTDACNLACKYCLYGDLYSTYGKRYNRFLAPQKAIILLNYLKTFWSKYRSKTSNNHIFLSFYGGEPLLNINFIKSIVKYSSENFINDGYNITYTMTTNGLLLNHHIDFLSKHNFKILISLDGNEFNNSYRTYKSGNPSFGDLYKIVNEIKTNYPSFFRNNISFNSVLHDRNSIDSVVKFISDEFDKVPSLGELNRSGVIYERLPQFNRMYRSMGDDIENFNATTETTKLLGLAAKPARQIYHYIRRYSDMYYEDYADLLNTRPRKYLPTGTCIPFSRKVFMTVSGGIMPCERISHEYILGHVKDNRLELDFQHCADVYNEQISAMENLCEKCHNRKGCVQCVFCLSDEDRGKRCGGFMSSKQFDEYEAQMQKFISNNPELFKSIIEEAVNI